MNKSPIRVSVVFVLLLTWGVWIFAIGEDFHNPRDTTHTWAIGAADYLNLYSYDDIGFSIVKDTPAYLGRDIETLPVYSHHPPLITWIPALMTKIMGDNVLAIRFAFPALMMIAASALYTLTKQMHGHIIAFWTLFLFTLNPMVSFFLVSFRHDSLGFFAAILYALIFYHWLKKPNTLAYIGLICTAILATWTAWPAVFFIGIIGIYGLLVGNNKQRIGIVILGIVTILSIIIMLLLYELWFTGSVSSIVNAFFWRISTDSSSKGTEPFTLIQWIITTLYHSAYYLTFSIIILAVIGFRYMRQQSSNRAFNYTIALFIAGLLYIIVFRNASFVHTYYKAFLAPALAIGAAYGIQMRNFRKGKSRFIRPVVDGLILAFVIQVVFVLVISYETPNREAVEDLTEFLSESDALIEPVYVLFPDSAFRAYMAVEYHSDVPLEWNILLEDIPTRNEPFTYILCYEDQTYIEASYGETYSSTGINDLCYLYQLPRTPDSIITND